MTLSPRESSEHIVKNAKYLTVLPDGIEKLAKEIISSIQTGQLSPNNFSQNDIHPKATDPHAIEWIFVVDTLNFCFWTPTDHTKYKVNGFTGYFALCAAINRAMDEGIDITNATYYSKIDGETLRQVFRPDDGQTSIPLFEQRIACLNEVGTRLLEKWQGKFQNVVRAANNSASRLLELIVSEFPCFRDEAVYEGQRVSLYKRAQILIGDIWSCFGGKGPGAFNDLEKITMFADYRVPQVLIHFGSLEYKPELLNELTSETILENGDAREVEIRGASIYIVEKVKDAILEKLAKKEIELNKEYVNSILIDHFLWDYRRKHAAELEHIPFHKVLSVYY
ncbi:queuosine salvage protein [Anastrepha ludens]|uniref:queuosine salvage protein n=1 Tax=Anastrepha ludens TaxID=28586 RepID=UPI0023B0B675|nr:queuosine salvage protein [Anastrepha ludens]